MKNESTTKERRKFWKERKSSHGEKVIITACALFLSKDGEREEKLEEFPEICWDNSLFIWLNGALNKTCIFRT